MGTEEVLKPENKQKTIKKKASYYFIDEQWTLGQVAEYNETGILTKTNIFNLTTGEVNQYVIYTATGSYDYESKQYDNNNTLLYRTVASGSNTHRSIIVYDQDDNLYYTSDLKISSVDSDHKAAVKTEAFEFSNEISKAEMTLNDYGDTVVSKIYKKLKADEEYPSEPFIVHSYDHEYVFDDSKGLLIHNYTVTNYYPENDYSVIQYYKDEISYWD